MSLTSEQIRERKKQLFYCGIIVGFFGAMSKVMVPAIIFDDLMQCGLNAAQIAVVGGGYMYGCAVSQFIMGLFSVRYDGVRLMVFGAVLFAVSSLLFPCFPHQYLILALTRFLAGFGSGTFSIGCWKNISDLFDRKFTMVLGIVQVIGYFGPTTGTGLMPHCIAAIGWQWSFLIPALASTFLMAYIWLQGRGTMRPSDKTSGALEPLWEMFRLPSFWLLCCSSTMMFSAYYIILILIGMKCLRDICGCSLGIASACMMGITILVAVCNVGVNWLLKLFHEDRIAVLRLSALMTFAGALLGFCTLILPSHSALLLVVAFLLIAVPAGFFPLYATIGKEMTVPKNMGLAIALVNGMAFLGIGLTQNIAGRILNAFQTEGATSFPPKAYAMLFLFMVAFMVLGLVASLLLKRKRT